MNESLENILNKIKDVARPIVIIPTVIITRPIVIIPTVIITLALTSLGYAQVSQKDTSVTNVVPKQAQHEVVWAKKKKNGKWLSYSPTVLPLTSSLKTIDETMDVYIDAKQTVLPYTPKGFINLGGPVHDNLSVKAYNKSNNNLFLGETKTAHGDTVNVNGDTASVQGYYEFVIEGQNDGDTLTFTVKGPDSLIHDLTAKNGPVIYHPGKVERWDLNTIPTVIIPVELTTFNYKISAEGDDVLLKWITASETNNYGFNIIRNGNKIGFVKGHGTTNIQHEYKFEDDNLPVGTQSYWLNQVDFSGESTLSEIIKAEIKAPKNYTLHPNFPNPFNPETTIGYDLPKQSKVLLEVYNMIGQKIRTLVDGKQQEPGRYNIKFNGRMDNGVIAPSGIYIYRLTTPEFTTANKMILLK